MRADGIAKTRVFAVHWLQDCNGCVLRCRNRGPPMAKRGYECEQLIDGGGRNKRRDKPDHTASSATPQATKHAPAQRNPVTVSLSITLARTVSTTMLAAVTGTAKL